MEKKFELTLIEALCVVQRGWGTEQEKELFDYAEKIIKHEREKQHFKYQLFIFAENYFPGTIIMEIVK